MPRTLLLAVLFATTASAQDMPLSQILIDGEGWTAVKSTDPRPKREPAKVMPTATTMGYQASSDPKAIRIESASGATIAIVELNFTPAGLTLSSDKSTLYVGNPDGLFLMAYPVKANGGLGLGNPYAPIRVAKGAMKSGVTDLTADAAGRIYAATPLGIQVFDPTGRLCGVIAPPGPGPLDFLAWDGNRLTVWAGDIKYTRKLSATAAK